MNAELPAPYYNIACGFARHEDVSQSLEYLKVAIQLDPNFHEEAVFDPDFDRIRETPEFMAFMKRHKP